MHDTPQWDGDVHTVVCAQTASEGDTTVWPLSSKQRHTHEPIVRASDNASYYQIEHNSESTAIYIHWEPQATLSLMVTVPFKQRHHDDVFGLTASHICAGCINTRGKYPAMLIQYIHKQPGGDRQTQQQKFGDICDDLFSFSLNVQVVFRVHLVHFRIGSHFKRSSCNCHAYLECKE